MYEKASIKKIISAIIPTLARLYFLIFSFFKYSKIYSSPNPARIVIKIEVKNIISKLSDHIIDNPNELSKYLIILTANLWKYGKDKIEKDVIQSQKWGEIRLECKTDGQADKRIKATDEWKEWQMAIVKEKTVLELIRSLKKRLQSLGDELKSY